MPLNPTVCFFDPISPYAWLAAKRIPELERATGATVVLEPVLFAGLLNANESKGPAEIPRKRAYTFLDVARLAARAGLPFEGPPGHPFNPLKALRMCAAVDDARARTGLATKLLEAIWERGIDPNDAVALAAVGADAGLDGATLLARTEAPDVKDRVRANTERALAAGAFGVPTFLVDEEIFWGADRMDLLAEFLGNRWKVDKARLDRMLARPLAAKRPGA